LKLCLQFSLLELVEDFLNIRYAITLWRAGRGLQVVLESSVTSGEYHPLLDLSCVRAPHQDNGLVSGTTIVASVVKVEDNPSRAGDGLGVSVSETLAEELQGVDSVLSAVFIHFLELESISIDLNLCALIIDLE